MNPVAIFDLISFLAALTSLIILFAFWKRVLPPVAKFFLVGFFVLIGFHGLSNTLEWSGITTILDPFEDYLEMLEPLFLGFFLYVFLRETADQALRESESKYRTLYSSMNEGLAFHEIIYDKSGEPIDYRILDVNPAYETILGIKKEEAMGAKATELYGIHEAPYLKIYSNVSSTGESTSFETFFEPMARYFKISVFSAGEGKFATFFKDITERKRAEEEIKQKTEDIALINSLNSAINRGESVQEIINLLSNETKRIFSSLGATIYFLSKDKDYLVLQNLALPQAVLKRIERIIGAKIPEVKIRLKNEKLYSQVICSKKPRLFNDRESIERLMADCTENNMLKKIVPKVHKLLGIRSVAAIPLVSEDDVLGLMDISRKEPFAESDLQRLQIISEQATTIFKRKSAEEELTKYHEHLEEMVKERTAELEKSQRDLINIVEDLNKATDKLKDANEQLQDLDRLKSMFIASMSHELRTPLNSIIGFTTIILQDMVGEITEEQRKQLIMVKNSANHLLSLINDIIDISKIEADKLELNIKKLDVPTLVKEVKDSFSVATEEKGLKISLTLPKKLAVESDERRVKQVLVNLINNAIKFTNEGKIEIKVAKKDKEVEISVEDTGIGIKENDIGKLFKAFSQIFVEGQPRQEGTGLGLYLSKKIIALLGGGIKAESKFGKGSAFTFMLPLSYREVKK